RPCKLSVLSAFLKPSWPRGRTVLSAEGARLEWPSPVTTPEAKRRHRVASQTRGKLRLVWDLIFGALRFIARRAGKAYAVFGIFLLSATAIAIVFTWAFSELAEHVRKGSTQPFDDAIMHWVGAHQTPGLEAVMLEVTALGTGTVVGMIVLIAGMFLWLNHH